MPFMGYLYAWLICGLAAMVFATWFYRNVHEVVEDRKHYAASGASPSMNLIWMIMFFLGPISFLIMGSVKLYEYRLASVNRQNS